MKRKRFSEEQIIGILRQADAGKRPDELARENGMSVGTFYAWKAKFGGMSVNEAQRLRALEDENRRLKALVADQALDNQMLRSVIEKKAKSSGTTRRGCSNRETIRGERTASLSGSRAASSHATLQSKKACA